MNQEEFDKLSTSVELDPIIKVSDLNNATPRTLVYGYTLERDTFHLYLGEDARFHLDVYDGDDFRVIPEFSADRIHPSNCVPSKRAYPAACDAEFCTLLQQRRVSLSFTTFDPQGQKQWSANPAEVATLDKSEYPAIPQLSLNDIGFTDNARYKYNVPEKELLQEINSWMVEMCQTVWRRFKFKQTSPDRFIANFEANLTWTVNHILRADLDNQFTIPPEKSKVLTQLFETIVRS